MSGTLLLPFQVIHVILNLIVKTNIKHVRIIICPPLNIQNCSFDGRFCATEVCLENMHCPSLRPKVGVHKTAHPLQAWKFQQQKWLRTHISTFTWQKHRISTFATKIPQFTKNPKKQLLFVYNIQKMNVKKGHFQAVDMPDVSHSHVQHYVQSLMGKINWYGQWEILLINNG